MVHGPLQLLRLAVDFFAGERMKRVPKRRNWIQAGGVKKDCGTGRVKQECTDSGRRQKGRWRLVPGKFSVTAAPIWL